MDIKSTWVILYAESEGVKPETLFGFSEEDARRLYESFQLTGEFSYYDPSFDATKNVRPMLMMIAEIRGLTVDRGDDIAVLIP